MRAGRSRSAVLLVAGALVLAACGGDGGDAGGDGGATSVTLQGTDALAFEPDTFEVAGSEEVTVALECDPTVEHTFVIEGVEGDEPLVECAAGETGTGTFTVDTGEYVFYCDVPGHREAGMEGTFTAS